MTFVIFYFEIVLRVLRDLARIFSEKRRMKNFSTSREVYCEVERTFGAFLSPRFRAGMLGGVF